ncbi:MAG: hypothetical protein ACI959_000906 [Limisphaerales bacterium]|jgi:hypothetical protein
MPDFIVLVLLAAVLSVILLSAMRMAFPRSKSVYRSTRTTIDLHQEFRYTGLLQFLVTTLIILASGALTYFIYEQIASLRFAGSLDKSEYFIRADLFERMVVALLGGGAVGFWFSAKLLRKILGERYEGYVVYQNRLSGLANELAAKWLSIGLFIALLCCSSMFLTWYTAFGPQGIRQDPLFSVNVREYKYENITRLYKKDQFIRADGKARALEHYFIEFENGQQWNSKNSGFEDPQRNTKLFQYLSDKTGISLDLE